MEENAVDKKMTPFEKNVGIWRQLWRVIDKSDLLCQIVDARNPLLFRSIDLEAHCTAVRFFRLLSLLLCSGPHARIAPPTERQGQPAHH
jgi:hypothetical protein